MGTEDRDNNRAMDRYSQERLKFFFLSVAFCFVIGGYTIAKELKDSIFASIIGKDYVPYAKMAAMIVLVPAIFLYSMMLDRVRRYQVLMIYSAFFWHYGITFCLFAGTTGYWALQY